MAFARLDNFDLYYETHGAATNPALVLIPGFASGAWIWQRQIEDLSERFFVVAFDPRGVSNSKIAERLAETVSVRTIADDVAKLLDWLDINKATIAGASFGGFVAQEFALRYPERLDKLILVCTTAGGANHVKAELEILRAFAPDPELSLSEHIKKFMRPAFSAEFNRRSANEIEAVCRLREMNPVPEKVYAAQLAAAFTFDSSSRIQEIKAPTLVVTGDQDAVVPPQNSENLARSIPNAALRIVENGGHLFFIEKATEFNRIVADFVVR